MQTVKTDQTVHVQADLSVGGHIHDLVGFSMPWLSMKLLFSPVENTCSSDQNMLHVKLKFAIFIRRIGGKSGRIQI